VTQEPRTHDREEAVAALRDAIIEGAVLPGAENYGEAAMAWLDANPTARTALARYLAPEEGLQKTATEALDVFDRATMPGDDSTPLYDYLADDARAVVDRLRAALSDSPGTATPVDADPERHDPAVCPAFDGCNDATPDTPESGR
jgi:hypothetical protein